MHIMFMAQCYAPEDVSAAVLITELATDLVRRGHQVTVVTGAPNYPYGNVFEGYRNNLFSTEMIDGVRVVRTWSYISPEKKVFPRLMHYGTYSASAFYGGLLAGRPDLLVSYSPPLPLGLSAWLLSRIWNTPWVLQIEDLYPDAAVAAGVLTNRRLINFFLGMEHFLYQRADRISVISENFRRTIINKQIPEAKLEVIPVWADPSEVYPMPKDNRFRDEFDLKNKFVVMYAGNIGLTSCLEDVLMAAEMLRDREDIQFVMIGEGVKKDALEAESRAKGLKNIQFLPFQPRERFAEMLAAADLSLVTINPEAALSSLPSKIFNVMASARPVMGISPSGSELAHIIQESGCGWNVFPGDWKQLAETIINIRNDQDSLTLRGNLGREYLEAKYTRQRCVDAHEKMLSKVCKREFVNTGGAL